MNKMITYLLSVIDDTESKDTFEQLYLTKMERVKSICKSFLKNRENINDACSETFMNLAIVYDRIKDIDSHQMDYYVYVTAKNAALQILRKEKKHMNNISLDEIDEVVSLDDIEKNDSDIIYEYLDKLLPYDREILNLRIRYELDYKTIGAMLCITPNAARQRFNRAKKNLAKLMTEETKNE